MLSTDDHTQELPAFTGQAAGDVLAKRFRLVKLLGNGNNGSVFLAEDLHLHCNVALKILHNSLLDSTVTTDKVRQEILLARGISHPNVIRVHDFYLAADCAFYTMDYISGISLAQYRLPQDKHQEAVAEHIGAQLIDAVEAIHRQGIVHCDITPQNVLLDGDNRLYLLDLGLASALSEVSHQSCTPLYSAPEVLQSAQHSPQSDYYAVAVTLYQLLTADLPFNQADMGQQLAAKLQSNPPLDKISKDFPRWRSFFLQNLAAHPQQRSQTGQQLKQLWLTQTAANKTKRRGNIASLLLLAAVIAVVFFMLSPRKEAPNATQDEQALTLPIALAVLPFAVQADNPQQTAVQGLVQQVIFEQLRSKNIRLIPPQRVQTTLQHLGFVTPLNDKQLQDLASLLGVDVILTNQITVLDSKVELAATLTDMRQPLLPQLWSDRQSIVLDSVSAGVLKQMNAMLMVLNTKSDPAIAEVQPLPDAAQQLYNQLMLAQANNNTQQLQSLLQQFQQRFPQLAIGYLLAAEWHEQQQNWLQAENLYAQAVQQSTPHSYEHLLSNARLAALQEQYSLADDNYQLLLQAKPFDTALTMEYANFLSLQNRYQDASAQLQLLATVDKTNPEIFLQLGKLAIRTGDISRAVDEYLLQAQVLFTRLKNKAGLADALNAVGVAMQRQGKFAEAIPNYQNAFVLFQEVEDVSGMAKTLSNLGFVQFVTGDVLQARTTLQKAIENYKLIKDLAALAITIDYLGILEEEQGEYLIAQRYFNDAFNIRSQIGDNWNLTESLINLGYIYFVLSEFDQSQVYLKQAEQNAVANNDALSLIKVRQSLAQLKIQQGEWGQAFRLFKSTSEDAEALDLTEDKLIAEAFLAKLAALHGNFMQAETQLLVFIEQAQAEQDPRAVLEFRLWLTELYQNSAQYDKAETQLTLLRDSMSVSSNNEQKQSLSLLTVNQLIGTGQIQRAELHVKRLQDTLQAQPLPRLELKAFIAQQHIQFMQGQPLNSLPVAYETFMRHHVPERLLWLELQALAAAKQGQTEVVGQLLNQALPLLRRATSYWRSFAFEYLQQRFKQPDRADHTFNLADTAEFERLLQQTPEPYRQAIQTREKAMMSGYVK
ncbi:protein kinase [Rheinheimera sp. UJ51]|uniref:protein kinase domain-containing protein n=1 Tax=Rheinheimera sp. UJ51 TaxID=2892446 RepID=UPI001E620814|nr:tetratricopeptide repeat protein [Rheinheimera sp. UJ51]MCC5452030.1 protein kinase [Rheinheimera sp. UJ51]